MVATALVVCSILAKAVVSRRANALALMNMTQSRRSTSLIRPSIEGAQPGELQSADVPWFEVRQ